MGSAVAGKIFCGFANPRVEIGRKFWLILCGWQPWEGNLVYLYAFTICRKENSWFRKPAGLGRVEILVIFVCLAAAGRKFVIFVCVWNLPE